MKALFADISELARQRKRDADAFKRDEWRQVFALAAQGESVITRHGRPAGVLIGFASEDDWFDYRIEHHPEFLRRITDARDAFRDGRGVRLEEI